VIRLRELVGAALRRRRLAQGRTLRQVADDAGISLTYLSEIERGRKEPSSEVLAALSDALGVVLSEVLREVAETLAQLEAAREAAPVGFLPDRPATPAATRTAPDRRARVVDLQAELTARLSRPAPDPEELDELEELVGEEQLGLLTTHPAPARPRPPLGRMREHLRGRVLDFQAYAARRSA
jgi:transcriptional regulator with XRE-family HTH domain